MYFNKIHHPTNFSFPAPANSSPPASGAVGGGIASGGTGIQRSLAIGERTFGVSLSRLREGVFRVDIRHEATWPRQFSQAELDESVEAGEGGGKVSVDADGNFTVTDPAGDTLIASVRGRGFGVCGKAWIMQIEPVAGMQIYGMGEKNIGFERSGRRTKFWNTDVWADFNQDQFINGVTDPMYVSVPYMIIKRDNRYCGILINNPYAVFMSTDAEVRIANQQSAESSSNFYVGAPDGIPSVYFLIGPSLDELTRKLQRLCGTTPLPPLWALGHQQCRWGYKGYADLDMLDKNFKKHEIPDDGLWLDIDYMDGFRVFTFSKEYWKDAPKQIKQIASRNRRVVPIIDPGVKIDPGYATYDDGLKKGVYCMGPEGKPFVGFVWPGATVFPDFSTEKGRDWWADQVKKFAESGVAGAWLDMNDPAVGFAELDEMRFDGGQYDHATYHSQYALGMARASREGFRRAQPNLRPFLLSRSGFISTSRHAAIWTGDNCSNRHHLKQAIPVSVNLALSGIPFNGPDVAGFGGDTTPELAMDWYKCCFLFPFFRNHSIIGSRVQEPWSLGPTALRVIRNLIRMRYKLLPYLYNLFIDQEETGAAILRPLFYNFEDTAKLPLGSIDDQFCVGDAILQAPILEEGADRRSVALPAGEFYDLSAGHWERGGRKLTVRPKPESTPVYVRDGSIVPMLVGTPKDNASDLSTIECHLFVSDKFKGAAKSTYRYDDGESINYKIGNRTSFTITATPARGKLLVTIENIRAGFKPVNIRFVAYGRHAIELKLADAPVKRLSMRGYGWVFTGDKIHARISPVVTVG